MKGRNKYGRPTEGVDEVPVRPKREKQNEECFSQLVDMLQRANKREEELKESVKVLERKYHSLYQEHLAYILSDLCVDCQTRRDNAWNGGCYETCNECREKIKTIAVWGLRWGLGLDIQKWLGKTGIAFHWPGYQYMGPGTKLEKLLKRGDPGINRLDRIAKQHDIDYSKAKNLQDKWKADAKMMSPLTSCQGKKQ